MQTENNRPKVGVGVMLFKDGKVLLGKRKGSFGVGEYSFPGGHLEYGESLEECAKRETKEECGLDIKNIKFLCAGNNFYYKPKHFVTICFTADWVKGEPQILEPDKCDSWDWYNIDNLPKPMFLLSQISIDNFKNNSSFYDIEK